MAALFEADGLIYVRITQKGYSLLWRRNLSMIDPEHVLKARLRWVRHDEHSQNAALACRRWGICQATLLKWWRR